MGSHDQNTKGKGKKNHPLIPTIGKKIQAYTVAQCVVAATNHKVKQLQQINKKQSSNNSKYSHQHVGSSTKKVEGQGYVPFGNTQSSHVLNEGQHSGI